MMFGLSLAKFVIVNDVGLDDVHHIRALASLAYAEHHKNLVYWQAQIIASTHVPR